MTPTPELIAADPATAELEQWKCACNAANGLNEQYLDSNSKLRSVNARLTDLLKRAAAVLDRASMKYMQPGTEEWDATCTLLTELRARAG